MTTTKFKSGYILWFFWILLSAIGLIFSLIKVFTRIGENGILVTLAIGLFLSLIIVVILIILMDYKYIRIDSTAGKITYHSLIVTSNRQCSIFGN